MTVPKRTDAPLVGSLGDILSTALQSFEDGDLPRTEAILRQVLDAMPDIPQAWHLRGLAAQKAGKLQYAADYLGEAQARSPDNAAYNRDLGAVLLALDCVSNARAVLEHAASLQPDDPAVRFHLANVQSQLGDISAAIENYEFSINRQPKAHDALANLSAAYRRAARVSDAIASARKAIELRHDFPEALNNLGLALCDARDYPAAIDAFSNALELTPENVEVLNNFAVALQADGRLDQACVALEKAIAARPAWPEALINLGNVLREKGDIPQAADRYREAAACDPNHVRAAGNLGLALLNLNQLEQSEATYKKALEQAPENADLRMSLGICQLAQGKYREGWANYEARWDATAFTAQRRDFTAPPWRGEPLVGKRILVFAEQGFGDTLQFCRFLPHLAAMGAEVHFECQRALVDLCKSVGGLQNVIARKDSLPETDYCVPLLSLPHLMGTTLETVPSDLPYLAANRSKSRAFVKQLQSEKINVGLVWLGNPERRDDVMRSCPAEALEPILSVDGLQFLSLQVGLARDDIPETTVDLGSDCADFADTAAAINAMDLVITVDTATAHLAGALGKPVWVMLGHHADWRYLASCDISPWYPTMRLFRQSTPGDWKGLTAAVAKRLSACRDGKSEFVT